MTRNKIFFEKRVVVVVERSNYHKKQKIFARKNKHVTVIFFYVRKIMNLVDRFTNAQITFYLSGIE